MKRLDSPLEKHYIPNEFSSKIYFVKKFQANLTALAFVTNLVTDMAANSQFAIAVHVLAVLAKHGDDERVKSDCIAKSVNTNPVVIRRLLCSLQQADLVESQTGASGGTRLAKAAKNIKLAEIYRAVAGDEIFALHPKTPNQDCPVGKNIAAILCNLQREVDHAIENRLAKYSLRDIIKKIEED